MLGDTADAGTPNVDTRGYARVMVTGGRQRRHLHHHRDGPAIWSRRSEIVLHGPVKTISAELEQGAIEVGGRTRIVVTALDAGDNPVANQNEVSVKTKAESLRRRSWTSRWWSQRRVNKDGGTVGLADVDKGDIPACECTDIG